MTNNSGVLCNLFFRVGSRLFPDKTVSQFFKHNWEAEPSAVWVLIQVAGPVGPNGVPLSTGKLGQSQKKIWASVC